MYHDLWGFMEIYWESMKLIEMLTMLTVAECHYDIKSKEVSSVKPSLWQWFRHQAITTLWSVSRKSTEAPLSAIQASNNGLWWPLNMTKFKTKKGCSVPRSLIFIKKDQNVTWVPLWMWARPSYLVLKFLLSGVFSGQAARVSQKQTTHHHTIKSERVCTRPFPVKHSHYDNWPWYTSGLLAASALFSSVSQQQCKNK